MKKLILLAAASVMVISANAQNANSSANQSVSLGLTNAIDITFTGNGSATGSAVSMPLSSVNDYASGVTSTAQQMKVRSNKAFTVSVKANAANFTYTGSATPTPTMPVSGVLGIMVSANGTGGTIATPYSGTAYSGITSTAANMLNNCLNGGNQLFSVQYQATPGFAYPAGNYAVDVVYTATQL